MIVSSFSHAASRVRLILAELQHSMTLSWLALTLSAVIILRLSGVLLPAELQGLSTLFVEGLESFFVVPRSDPSLYFAAVQFFGLGSRVLKFSLFIEFRSCSKSIRATEHPRPNHNFARVPTAYGHQSLHDQTFTWARVPKAYGHQSLHDQTLLAFRFQEHTVARACMTEPYLRSPDRFLRSLSEVFQRLNNQLRGPSSLPDTQGQDIVKCCPDCYSFLDVQQRENPSFVCLLLLKSNRATYAPAP